MAIALGLRRRFEDAHGEWSRAEAALTRVTNEPALATVLATHRLTLDVLAGRASARDAARAMEPRVLASPSDDARFALRMLRRAEEAREAQSACVVFGAGEAFRWPAGNVVPLPPRSPMRRVLDRLVAERLARPGAAVSVDDLVAAGWPGERIREDAALNRLYVALATLRKRGLRELIVSTEGGYALSRAVPFERAPSRETARGQD
jgi:hypothetical protein